MPAKLSLKLLILVLAFSYHVFSSSAAEDQISVSATVEKQLSVKMENDYLQISSNTGPFVVVVLDKENSVYRTPTTFADQTRIPFSAVSNYYIFPKI